MTAYMIAIGHNNQAGLGTVVPQPRSRGLMAGRRQRGMDQLLYEDGFYHTTWEYGYMTIVQHDTFEAAAGIGEGTPSAFVTVRTPQNTGRTFNDYNATIIRPNPPEESAEFNFTVWHGVNYQIEAMSEI